MIVKRLLNSGLLGLLLILIVWLAGPAQLQAETPVDPSIEIVPAELSVSQVVSTVETHSLTMNNLGATDLIWRIEEEAEAAVLAPAPRSASPTGAIPSRDVVTSASQCARYENYAGEEPAGYAEHCAIDIPPAKAASALAPLGPTDIAYAQDIGFTSDDFVSFTLDDFGGRTALGQNAMRLYGYAFDRSGTILYALDNGGQLGVVDTADGAFTPIGPSIPLDGHNWSGIAIHPATGEGFVSSTDTTISALYTIDLTTGEVTLIDSQTTTPLLIDISFSPDGTLYGHDILHDAIFILDTATAEATLVGPTGYNANFAQGMDFDWSDGTLYVFLYLGAGNMVFGTVDLDTGAVTPLLEDSGEFEGAIPNAQICSTPSDIPWASVSPTSGMTPPGGSSEVLVTFDTSDLTAGNTYSGTLCINSNDPVVPWIEVPLSLAVVEAPVVEYRYLPFVIRP